VQLLFAEDRGPTTRDAAGGGAILLEEELLLRMLTKGAFLEGCLYLAKAAAHRLNAGLVQGSRI
jgi:hypothetical protein